MTSFEDEEWNADLVRTAALAALSTMSDVPAVGIGDTAPSIDPPKAFEDLSWEDEEWNADLARTTASAALSTMSDVPAVGIGHTAPSIDPPKAFEDLSWEDDEWTPPNIDLADKLMERKWDDDDWTPPNIALTNILQERTSEADDWLTSNSTVMLGAAAVEEPQLDVTQEVQILAVSNAAKGGKKLKKHRQCFEELPTPVDLMIQRTIRESKVSEFLISVLKTSFCPRSFGIDEHGKPLTLTAYLKSREHLKLWELSKNKKAVRLPPGGSKASASSGETYCFDQLSSGGAAIVQAASDQGRSRSSMHSSTSLKSFRDVNEGVDFIDGTTFDQDDGSKTAVIEIPSQAATCQGVSHTGPLTPRGALEWSDGDASPRGEMDASPVCQWQPTSKCASPGSCAEAGEVYLDGLQRKLSSIVAHKARYLQKTLRENVPAPGVLPEEQKQAWCKHIQSLVEEDLLALVWAEWNPITCSKGVQLWDACPHKKKKGAIFTNPSNLLKYWQRRVCRVLTKLDSSVKFVTANGQLNVQRFGASTLIDFVKQTSGLNVWNHKGQPLVFPNLVHRLLFEYEIAEIEYAYKATFDTESLLNEHRELGFGSQVHYCDECGKPRTVGRHDMMDSRSWLCQSCFKQFYGMWAWHEDGWANIRDKVQEYYFEEKRMCSSCEDEMHYGQCDPLDPGDAAVADWYCVQCFLDLYGLFPWNEQGRNIIQRRGPKTAFRGAHAPPVSKTLKNMQREPRLAKHKKREVNRVASINHSIMVALAAVGQPEKIVPPSKVSSVWEACSAPASFAPRQCLLPSTLIRIANEATNLCSASEHTPADESESMSMTRASNLIDGAHVRGGVGVSIVRHSQAHPTRERDVVRMTFCENVSGAKGALTVTTSQSVPVRRQISKQFLPLPASDIQRGDTLWTHVGGAIIVDTVFFTMETGAIEVELQNKTSTMFVGDPVTDFRLTLMFVEVYGELAPPPPDQFVKILQFQRSTNFKQALLDGVELRACRDDLELHGFSADLSRHQLGPGKMFVDPTLASRTLDVLRHRGKHLQAREVVVDRSFEAPVLDAALHIPGARPNHLMGTEPLDLSRSTILWITDAPVTVRCSDDHIVIVERTFLKLPPPLPVDARSVVTSSTTDARGKSKNPRAIAEQLWWN